MAVIRLNRTLNNGPAEVFSALTEQESLRAWFAPHVIVAPVAGTYAAFAFEEEIHFKVQIKELVRYRKIVWAYVEGNLKWDNSKITFKLEETKNGKTLLTFSHSGLTDTGKIEKWTNSWRVFLDKLKEFAEKE